MEGLVAMETIRNLKTATLALALGDQTTSDVVRISHSQMAPLVSVTLTTQMELFAVLSGDGAHPNQSRVLVVPASTTAEVSLNIKGRKSSWVERLVIGLSSYSGRPTLFNQLINQPMKTHVR